MMPLCTSENDRRARVGSGVRRPWAPVGRPASVPDAGDSVGRAIRVDFFHEVHELADRAAHVEAIRTGQGDARRVVATVLQARQTAEDHLAAAPGSLTSNMSNNSAHATNSNTSIPFRHTERMSIHVAYVR